jgi:DNA replication protein DnaC
VSAPRESAKRVSYLASALKAPRIADVASRLAEEARSAKWDYEDYLVAVLEREVSARAASGAQLRINAAGRQSRSPLTSFARAVPPR